MLKQNRNPHKNIWLFAGISLFVMGAICMIAAIYYRTPSNFGAVDEQVLLQIPIDEIPEGSLYITESRKSYGDGSMQLIIPAIQLETNIGRSTEPDELEKNPGLYEFAQLPGPDNVNVSIAGHRDIFGQEFYSLDRITAGDHLYLVYEDLIYRYDYLDSKVVSPNEWEVIKPQGFSCLTLTTCDPIGSTRNRLIVRGVLKEIVEDTVGYEFA